MNAKNTTTEKRASVRFWTMAVKAIDSSTISCYGDLSYYGIAASLRPRQGSAKLMKFCTDMPAHMRLWMVGSNDEQEFWRRLAMGCANSSTMFHSSSTSKILWFRTPVSPKSWATHDFAIAELCNSLDPLPAMCSNLSVRSHIPYLSQFHPATVHKKHTQQHLL